MVYLIDPIEADKMARIDCTCYSGSVDECTPYNAPCPGRGGCIAKCASNCEILVCGQGVARRITIG